MPKRVIQDALFQYADKDGRRITAYHGEEHDIPEGKDLARGDKWGAFTKDNREPAPPENTHLPEIQTDWSEQEWIRYVDAGREDEIIGALNAVEPENKVLVAEKLIVAEQGRGTSARATLLEGLASIATGGSSSPEDPQLPTDLEEFVEQTSVPKVLERAGNDPEAAAALREAEEARGERARQTLVVALKKIEAGEA